jgi:hypothetical protein
MLPRSLGYRIAVRVRLTGHDLFEDSRIGPVRRHGRFAAALKADVAGCAPVSPPAAATPDI